VKVMLKEKENKRKIDKKNGERGKKK